MGERVDGTWAAFEVGIVVPRQNGKNAILTARELAGIVLFDEDLIIHSAHRADTTLEQFRKMEQLAEEFDEFSKLVKRVSRVNGHEGIELKGGRRINFVSRARNPGRGFSGACVVLDEAFNLDPSAIGAMIPTLSARSLEGAGVQVWYTSSAPHADSVVLHGVRSRGHGETDNDRLFYAEWGNDADVSIDDHDAVYVANPGAGYRIADDYLHAERQLMSAVPLEYLRERLGVAEEPVDTAGELPITAEMWQACLDEGSSPLEHPVVFGVDASPDRRFASIVVAGHRADGLGHLEVVDHGDGVSWLVRRLVELRDLYGPVAVAVDPVSPAWSVVPELESQGVPVSRVATREMVGACGAFFDAVKEQRVRHRGDPQFQAAVFFARKRTVGDGWAWSRRDSSADITPLVAATLAFGALPAAQVHGHTASVVVDLVDF